MVTPLDSSAPPALATGSCSIRLGKYALRPSSLSNSQPAPSLLPIIVANDLVRLAQAHAARHFVIEGLLNEGSRAPDKVVLTVWLFLESFDVAVSKTTSTIAAFHGVKDNGYRLRACKVMYRCDSAQSVDNPSTTSWSQPGMIERLAYPNAWCLSLVHFLQLSTSCLAPSQRTFGPWTVGFLEMTGSQ